jgi:hypothetical protein
MYLKNIGDACTGPLAAMAKRSQFIVCKFVPQPAGKTLKIPINPHNGRAADATDPTIWISADAARRTAGRMGVDHGVGFVFTERDPFFFVDIDNCRSGGELNQRATQLLMMFEGAAVEVSQSDTGLHIFGVGAPDKPHRTHADDDSFELYTRNRFVALTGTDIYGDAGSDHADTIQDVLDKWFKIPHIKTTEADWTTTPVIEWRDPGGIDAIIKLAKASRSARSTFGGAPSFADLFDCNEPVLTAAYPDDHGRGYDASRADMAMATHLMFFTGCNCEMTKDIMLKSALDREKWEKREKNYLEVSILKALRHHDRANVYRGRPGNGPTPPISISDVPPPPPPPGGDIPMMLPRTGPKFLFPDQQPVYFKGCVYIYDMDRVMAPDGQILSTNGFNVRYGGRTFVLDQDYNKTTKNPSEVFLHSPHNECPTVHELGFNPFKPVGHISTTNHGIKSVNSYGDQRGPQIEGDVTPFLTHVEKLLPNVEDREILLTYMSACLQKIGHKFQWCILLQGVEGNGKTVFYRCLEQAVGPVYCHQLDPADLTNKFNAWIARRLLVGIEEIAVKGKWEIADRLKPLITNERVPLQAKGDDQTTTDNRANFLMTSNHKDAVLKTKHDRRYCVFYTAQQEACDIEKDGMQGTYFKDLYTWLKSGGYAHVSHYLANRPLSTTVDLFGRAPRTTSTAEAIKESRPAAEVELLDAIETGLPGFRNGMTTAYRIREFLDKRRRSSGPRTIKKLVNAIGYVIPPSVKANGGRIIIDAGRHTLYVDSTNEDLMKMTVHELAMAWDGKAGEEY